MEMTQYHEKFCDCVSCKLNSGRAYFDEKGIIRVGSKDAHIARLLFEAGTIGQETATEIMALPMEE